MSKSSYKLTRRSFLSLGAAAVSGILLAACVPPATQTPSVGKASNTATPAPLNVKITHVIGAYYPSESMEWSETNPNPHNMINTLIKEYKDLRPGVEIELIQPPPTPAGGMAREYIVSNMTANTIPNIVGTLSRDQVEEVAKGWWVTLDDYLNLPNPYIKAGMDGNKRWIDQFYQVPFESQRVLGQHYNLPYEIVTSMMFYNKDIFEKVGVKIPETVTELLETFKALKGAGQVAYGGIGSWFMYETLGQLGGSIMASLTPKVNPNGGSATYEEVACAIQKGIFRASTPEYREWMRVMKEIAAYRTPDWIDKNANAITKWLNGQIVVIEDGTWRIGANKKNPNIQFKWGMFYPPKADSAACVGCTGAPCPPIGGATGTAWAITKGAVRDNNVAECADWLMFLCAPQNAERLINELGNMLPIQKDARPVDPDLIAVLGNLKDQSGEDAMWTYYDRTDAKSRTDIWDLKNAFILDELTMDDAVRQIDVIYSAYADDFITKNDVDCAALGFS
ncbi:MAG: ABC transporter substrate-binding protein [Armatimonadota bacterium]